MKTRSRELKKYLASFSAAGSNSTPPCRSYQNLIFLDELDEMFVKLSEAESQVGWVRHILDFMVVMQPQPSVTPIPKTVG